MKKTAIIFIIAFSLAGGAVTIMSAPSYAQVYQYAPPPANPYQSPWVGPGTPWVYYNGDWFLNGMLYYYFGSYYGWAPYYAYPPMYVVRPGTWYGPRWLAWYQRYPQYWRLFWQEYPYWRKHREGERYSQKFYEEHHRVHGFPFGDGQGLAGFVVTVAHVVPFFDCGLTCYYTTDRQHTIRNRADL